MVETLALTAEKLFNVEGWVCVITGGGSGIGLMAAQTLAANGAKVYITGRRAEALEKAVKSHDPSSYKGEIIAASPCDVTSKSDLEKLVSEISTKEPYINLLIAAAGISGPKAEPDTTDAVELSKKLWEEEGVEEWGDTYRTDVTAVYFTTVAFLPLLQKGSKEKGELSAGVIVISSMSGVMRHAQGHFSYNAAKGGTVQLSKLMSGEFQKLGIRVNSIAPGYFPSEMTTGESGGDQKSELPDEKVQDKGHVPMARGGKDEEMGMAVLFLAKNYYVNGVILTVDGGVMNVIPG
ncbi:short chain dehydrogenase/reductase-like protein family [Tothia fuscella]|uniref:Short chain dehydrogenase/reductase-like protein family n=1 Tax=Tothia fuscella TaxID=1048955 RepID=A0A9P4NTK6_9PEZI|nr:short chain dehydrogenase/reductase-like protein family [Tothia fuscella]